MKKSKARPEKSPILLARQEPVAKSEPTSSIEPLADTWPIVGIGASAGGLEAFAQLLRELPSNTGMAFVLIQHLDPTHTSLLAEVLAKATKMPVCQAEDGKRIEPDHVYVIPPNADIAILHGQLTLFPRNDEARKLHLPVDFFFQALAADRGSHAIGVVLSGTASDGTEGLKAIKARDGITFAQSPDSAKFDGMPRSAVEAGVVDYSLPLPALARELIRLSRHPYIAALRTRPQKSDDSTRRKIFLLVRSCVGVDFSEYKAATFDRRVARRMVLRRAEDIQQYLAILQKEPAEIQSLYEDVLIHVTSFFRDPEVFESLKTQVFSEILKRKAEGVPVRMWVAGCATGEEVYSLAIALLEFMGDAYRSHAIQIFGSDVSEKAILKARVGVYPDSALRDVSDERRRRYFTKIDTGYRIHKTVRDLCVFVRHDIARDPPFSKLDVVSCRNVLIYFEQELQKRVMATFHFSLNQPGILVLGHAESTAGLGHLFSAVDTSSKLFARNAVPSRLRFAPRQETHPSTSNPGGRRAPELTRRADDLGKQLDHMLVARYSPPGVLINERMDILQFRGEIGDYLRPAAGEAQNNLFKMAREGLLSDLRKAIAQAKKDMAPVRVAGMEIDENGLTRTRDIQVMPFTGLPDASERLFVVTFEEGARAKKAKPVQARAQKSTEPADARRVSRLEQELRATKEYLQTLMEDHDRANDELNAANEEFVSGNEELQSMNEELETAKEELQSTNEELTTVNDELHSRNCEVNEINSDLVNLLGTVDIPILILDRDRHIRRFTPKARSILNVLPSDVGRPLHDIRVNVSVSDLDERIRVAMDTNLMHESEVQDRDGRWYRMQIRPYKTTDNRIDGATLSLVDIDVLKRHLAEAQQAKDDAERANGAKDQFLAILSHELRTPLGVMLLHSQLLCRDGMDPRVKRAGEAIERATNTQTQLIDDLLDVSRIVTGKLLIDIQVVDLCAVVRAAIEAVSPMAERKATRMDISLDESIGRVSGDPARLQQVVSNLLTNAIKFTPQGGRVTVSLEAVGGHAHLTVRDTGVGIAASFLPHIFNRFTQEDGSSTRAHGGLGLGLAIVRHLVEAHQGTVEAQSPGPGKGTTISILLPLTTAGAPARGAGQSSSSREASLWPSSRVTVDDARLNNLRVLVVDDDLGTREAVAEMLRQVGANVRMAESAASALAAVDEFRPEVLLCDIAMPHEDGYELIRNLRARGAAHGGNTPALALTALAGEEHRLEALSAGFQMHVAKPADIATLTLAVAELSRSATPTEAR